MSDLPPDARTHREQFMRYVVGKAEEWHRKHLGDLYSGWATWNRDYFGGQLVPPYILLAEPSNPRALGDFAVRSCFGGLSQIRVRPSLVTGSHRMLRPGPEFAEGRRRFVHDVGLHETVHLYCQEILGNLEPGYKGHGPIFAAECNRIGAMLGLPPVRPAKARGKDKGLPSCAYWQECVRPAGYYLGALVEPAESGPSSPAGDDQPDILGALVGKTLAALAAADALAGELARVFAGYDQLRLRGEVPDGALANFLRATLGAINAAGIVRGDPTADVLDAPILLWHRLAPLLERSPALDLAGVRVALAVLPVLPRPDPGPWSSVFPAGADSREDHAAAALPDQRTPAALPSMDGKGAVSTNGDR